MIKLFGSGSKESLLILEDFFPKDKPIFLMCGGGYAGMTKSLLIFLGWDVDAVTGATVSTSNITSVLQSLFSYHCDKYYADKE